MGDRDLVRPVRNPSLYSSANSGDTPSHSGLSFIKSDGATDVEVAGLLDLGGDADVLTASNKAFSYNRRTLRFIRPRLEAQYRVDHVRTLAVGNWIPFCKYSVGAAVVTAFIWDIARHRTGALLAARATMGISMFLCIVVLRWLLKPRNAALLRHGEYVAAFFFSAATLQFSVQQNWILADHQEDIEDTGRLVIPMLSLVMAIVPNFHHQTNFVMQVSFLVVDVGLHGFVGTLPWWLIVLRLLVFVYAIYGGFSSDMLNRRSYAALQHTRAQHAAIQVEGNRSRKVLLNILPSRIAAEIRRGVSNPAAFHDAVTVVYADVVGFTPFCSQRSSEEVVRVLNRLMWILDDLCDIHGVEKIVTVGDAYLAVCGMPEAVEDHARRAVCYAQALLRKLASKRRTGALPKLSLRVGIASGPVVGAVLGDQRFFYAAFGSAVEQAVAMEGSGVPDQVHLAASTMQLLDDDTLGGLDLVRRPDGTAILRADSPEQEVQLATSMMSPLSSDAEPGMCVPGQPRSRASSLHDDPAAPPRTDGPGDEYKEPAGPATTEEELLAGRYHVLRCRFKDKDQEKRFQVASLRSSAYVISVNHRISIATWLALALIDPLGSGGFHVDTDLLAARLAVLAVLCIIAGAFVVMRRESSGTVAEGRDFLWMARLRDAFAVAVAVGHLACAYAAPYDSLVFVDKMFLGVFVVYSIVGFQCLVRASLAYSLLAMTCLGTIMIAYAELGGIRRVTGGALALIISSGFFVCGLVSSQWKVHALFLLRDLQARASAELSKDREATENLLLNILPFHIVQTLRSPTRPDVLADSCPAASMLFVKIRGFPEFADRQSFVSNLAVLQDFVQRVDSVMLQHGLQRLKVFGTTYFAASSFEDEDGKEAADAARRTVEAALEVIDTARKHFDEWSKMLGGGRRLSLGLGVNTGPVTAGVIGKLKFQYDAWGDAVNLSARLADYAPDNTLLISEETREQLGVAKDLNISDGAVSSIKGKGLQRTFVVAAKEQEEQALQTSAQLPELNESGRRMTTITAISLEN